MNIVLGAGIAGLGAYAADPSLYIFEKNDYAGGLCSSFQINGFVFDQAVHLSFTKDAKVREYFDRTEQYRHHPIPYSWYRERWLQHPAQNNLYPINAEEKVQAIKSFVEKKEFDSDNFAGWMKSQYGEWLYNNLFKPYNEKYWCTDLTTMGIDWIGNRMYRPTLEEILYGSYTWNTENTYYAKEMRYPNVGGYKSFIQPIINEATERGHLFYNKKIDKIDIIKKSCVFQDGECVKYTKLFSSIPLNEIFDYIDDVPSYIYEKAHSLEYTGVAIISVGFKSKIALNKMWFYIYDSDILAARAYVPSKKSPNNVPNGYSSIQFEIYFNGQSPVPDRQLSIDNTIYAIKKLTIADPKDIIFTDYRVLPYGNIIFKKETQNTASELTSWLENVGISSIGRFGEWKYFWSDQAFMSGYNSAKKFKE